MTGGRGRTRAVPLSGTGRRSLGPESRQSASAGGACLVGTSIMGMTGVI